MQEIQASEKHAETAQRHAMLARNESSGTNPKCIAVSGMVSSITLRLLAVTAAT